MTGPSSQRTGMQQNPESQPRSTFWLPAGLLNDEPSNTPHQSPSMRTNPSVQAAGHAAKPTQANPGTPSEWREATLMRPSAPVFQPENYWHSANTAAQVPSRFIHPSDVRGEQAEAAISVVPGTNRSQWWLPSKSHLRSLSRNPTGQSEKQTQHPEAKPTTSWRTQIQRYQPPIPLQRTGMCHHQAAQTSHPRVADPAQAATSSLRLGQSHRPQAATSSLRLGQSHRPQAATSSPRLVQSHRPQAATSSSRLVQSHRPQEGSGGDRPAASSGTTRRGPSRSSRRIAEKSMRTCYRCRRKGHEAADCPALPPDAPWGPASKESWR